MCEILLLEWILCVIENIQILKGINTNTLIEERSWKINGVTNRKRCSPRVFISLQVPSPCLPTISAYTPPFSINSICVPLSTTLPASITKIQSALCTVLNRCATAIVVRLLSFTASSKASCMIASEAESSAEVASSRRRIRGLRINARARARRCFCPPERRTPLVPIWVARPCGSDV